MVEEHERLLDEAGEEADGAVDADAAEAEISDTAGLEAFEVRV